MTRFLIGLVFGASVAVPTALWKVQFKDPYSATSVTVACRRVGPLELRCVDLSAVLKAQVEQIQEQEELKRRQEALERQWHPAKEIDL